MDIEYTTEPGNTPSPATNGYYVVYVKNSDAPLIAELYRGHWFEPGRTVVRGGMLRTPASIVRWLGPLLQLEQYP